MELPDSRGHQPDDILYLSQANVSAVAPPLEELVDLVEGAFVAVGRDDVVMPPGPGLEPRPGAFLHPMIAYAGDANRICLKWLAGYADNKQHGLPEPSSLPSMMAEGRPPDDNFDGRTLYLSLGLAAEDLVVASAVLDRAREAGQGVLLPR